MVRIRSIILLIIACCLFVAGFADNTRVEAAGGTGYLRFAHASPDAPSFDIYLDGKLSPFIGVAYGTATAFAELPAKTYQLALRLSGSPTTSRPVYQSSFKVGNGLSETAVMAGLTQNDPKHPFTIFIFPTYRSASEKYVSFEMFYAVPDLPDKAQIRWDPMPEGVVPSPDYGTYVRQLMLPGPYSLNLVVDASSAAAAKIEGSTDLGMIYTTIIAGTVKSNSFKVIQLSAPPIGDAIVHIVHAAPDLGPIDVYIDGKITSPNGVSYTSVSPFIGLKAGPHTLDLRSAGAAADSPPVYSQQISLGIGTANALTIVGSQANGLAAVVFPINLSHTKGGTRFIFIDASNSQLALAISANQIDGSGQSSLEGYIDKGTGPVLDFEVSVAAGKYAVSIESEDSRLVTFRSGELTVGADTVCTVLLVKMPDSNDLKAIVIKDISVTSLLK